ncbi:MAG TPA: hypothetical protein VJN18_36170 [Polyangiaceae bacterium]|nr:hypothetical protein [Polyangiaceae bacterium]
MRVLAGTLGLQLLLCAPRARADLGRDLERARQALAGQIQTDALRVRLLEREDITPLALPPWALDPSRGECTTLILLAPVTTQFLLHAHPWPGLPSALGSSAGAVQLTRCGRERVSLLQVLVEMRSPRAVVHTLVAVGSAAPVPLTETLPERDTGREAALGEPGPAPPRAPLAERLKRFERAMRQSGAAAVEIRTVPRLGQQRFSLSPGCHQLLVSRSDDSPFRLELREVETEKPRRLEPSEQGDIREELCAARERSIWLSVDRDAGDGDVQLAVARFPLPSGLPGRFGPEVAERLTRALGGSAAPRRLGPLVFATLGAQGRTPLPRALLPNTCYVAAVTALHGDARALSLGVQSGSSAAEATSTRGTSGPRLGFCTGKDGRVALDVEARGLGVAWLLCLFQMGRAQPEPP